MKILILNYEHPPIGGGGGRLAAKVGAGLVARGHQVRVLTAREGLVGAWQLGQVGERRWCSQEKVKRQVSMGLIVVRSD